MNVCVDKYYYKYHQVEQFAIVEGDLETSNKMQEEVRLQFMFYYYTTLLRYYALDKIAQLNNNYYQNNYYDQ